MLFPQLLCFENDPFSTRIKMNQARANSISKSQIFERRQPRSTPYKGLALPAIRLSSLQFLAKLHRSDSLFGWPEGIHLPFHARAKELSMSSAVTTQVSDLQNYV